MNRFFKASVLILSLSFSLSLKAQLAHETPLGWQFGLNFGYYAPSKYTANYYNGSETNVNNARFVMSNYYWYQEIFQKLLAADTVFISGLPSNMHYKIALMPGLYGQFTFNENYAVYFEFNYMSLKAQDAITFEVDPKTYLTTHDLRMYTIRGQEERVYLDLGIKRTFSTSGKARPFIMAGFNMNNTRVKKASFFVDDKEYSMINNYINGSYVPNSNSQTVNIYQGGIGFGLNLAAGATFQFGDISFEPGITAHWLDVKLEGYPGFKPGVGLYVRFLFNKLLASE